MTITTALANLRAAVDAAVKTALAPGASPAPVLAPGLSGAAPGELKRQLPGSLFELADGSFVMVPLTGGVVSTAAGTEVVVKAGASLPGTKRSMDWLGSNVNKVALGVLSFGGRAGAAADSLQMAGVQVGLWPADSPITTLTMSAVGGGSTDKSVNEALSSCGASWRSWEGGLVEPTLRSTHPLLTLDAAKAADTTRSRLTAGGGDVAASFLRPAKLEPLGLLDPIRVETAAHFVALLAGQPHAARPLAIVLSTTGAVMGGSPPPDVAAVGAARSALAAALGGLLDDVTPAMLNDAAARLAALRAEGLAADHSGGHTLAQVIDAIPSPPAPAPAGPAPAGPPAGAGALVVAPAAAAPAAGAPPLTLPPPTATAGAPAAGLAAPPPLPIAGPPAPAPAALAGMQALRPLVAAGAAPMSDTGLFQAIGGEALLRKMAQLCGVADPLIDLTGAGAAPTAAQAAKDFCRLLPRAQAADPDTAFSTPPLDIDEARARAFAVVRAVQEDGGGLAGPSVGAGLMSPGAAPADTSRKPPAGTTKALREVSSKADGKVYARAVTAAVLLPLAEPEAWRSEAAARPWGTEALSESRRLIGALGRPVYSFLTSNTQCIDTPPGEVPASLVACHALLLDLPAARVAPLIGGVRLHEAEATVRLFSLEVLCADIDLDRAVRLCAALPPTVTNAAGRWHVYIHTYVCVPAHMPALLPGRTYTRMRAPLTSLAPCPLGIHIYMSCICICIGPPTGAHTPLRVCAIDLACAAGFRHIYILIYICAYVYALARP